MLVILWKYYGNIASGDSALPLGPFVPNTGFSLWGHCYVAAWQGEGRWECCRVKPLDSCVELCTCDYVNIASSGINVQLLTDNNLQKARLVSVLLRTFNSQTECGVCKICHRLIPICELLDALQQFPHEVGCYTHVVARRTRVSKSIRTVTKPFLCNLYFLIDPNFSSSVSPVEWGF